MDRKIPRVCFVIALILASTFLLVPASNAEPRETPRAALRAGTDWLGSALTWLNGLLEGRVERDRNRTTSVVAKAEDGGDESSVTGICIDPMGRPRPCPDA
jgi:hypothetical protein